MRAPPQFAPMDWRRIFQHAQACALRAIAYRRWRSTGKPARSTGSSMRVRGLNAASISSGSMLRVTGSTSTNTGRAPARTITLAVDTQDSGEVITSSPGPMSASASAISMAPVAELITRTGRPPQRRITAPRIHAPAGRW